MKKTAVFWNYKFSKLDGPWSRLVNLVINSLQKYEHRVFKHHQLEFTRPNEIQVYNHKTNKIVDVCVYNHCDRSHLIGNILKANDNWFLKPTVPHEDYGTLDHLGYGPYSSISYSEPDYHTIGNDLVDEFFKTKVAKWKNDRCTKWGELYEFQSEPIQYNNYYLVVGQCGGDEVVTKHDFGHYFSKMKALVSELSRIDRSKIIVVKLHPHTDGAFNEAPGFAETIKDGLIKISDNVKVFTGYRSIHDFVEKASCVFLANSGAGFEAMMYDKPIVAWGYPEYHWVTYDLRHLADLGNAVKTDDWFNVFAQRRFLYWYLERYCIYDQDTCDRRVLELIQEHECYEKETSWEKADKV